MDLVTVWNPQRHMFEMRSKSGKTCIETGKCMKTKERHEEIGAGVKIYKFSEEEIEARKIGRVAGKKNKNIKLDSILANAKVMNGGGLMVL